MATLVAAVAHILGICLNCYNVGEGVNTFPKFWPVLIRLTPIHYNNNVIYFTERIWTACAAVEPSQSPVTY
jgi:hypothetical protein